MRFSVRVPAQNAPFRRVHFSLSAQTWSRLTEKRTLGVRPHGKAHSGRSGSRKSTVCAGGLTEKHTLGGESRRVRLSVTSQPQNASFRRVRFSLPAQTWSRLTEKRILGAQPHGKAHSGRLESRKSAFWIPPVGQSAPFRETKLQAETCGPSSNPPRSLAGGLPHTSWAPRRDGKTHSGAVRHLTRENRVLAADYP